MEDSLFSIVKSWNKKDNCINDTVDIIDWINEGNKNLLVDITKNKLEDSNFWSYNEEKGIIQNKNNSFFHIIGLREHYKLKEKEEIVEQPIIIQDEIGYLGIICKEFNGIMYFLMQAKIEPGNLNKIQLSPTIQATKSNFTQKHGGKRPAYIDYFINADKYEIIVDQIQSEQSSRFYKKRNRNIIIKVNEDIEVLSSHKWMTLGQIKVLMRVDNLVNMDTRTVLSCIPYYKLNYLKDKNKIECSFKDKTLYRSIVNEDEINLIGIYNKINDIKMYSEKTSKFVKLKDLKSWHMQDGEFVCKKPYPYKIIFCKIAIEGREVKEWTQPLFEAIGDATFGLLMRNNKKNEKREFLVKIKHELGCFDEVELAPTLQIEAVHNEELDSVEKYFLNQVNNKKNIVFDHYLSEEGGRFYHEQNRNLLVMQEQNFDLELPKEYMWLDYKTLNYLVQHNNILNIQLRNLLSLLEI